MTNPEGISAVCLAHGNKGVTVAPGLGERSRVLPGAISVSDETHPEPPTTRVPKGLKPGPPKQFRPADAECTTELQNGVERSTALAPFNLTDERQGQIRPFGQSQLADDMLVSQLAHRMAEKDRGLARFMRHALILSGTATIRYKRYLQLAGADREPCKFLPDFRTTCQGGLSPLPYSGTKHCRAGPRVGDRAMSEENDLNTQPPDPFPPAAPGRREFLSIPSPAAEVLATIGLQSAGLQPECRHKDALVSVTLNRATALLSSQVPGNATTRTPISDQSVWLVPAATPHSAHWHEPVLLLRIFLRPDEVASVLGADPMPPRVVRLADLVRICWPIAEIIGEAQTVLAGGLGVPLAVSRAHELALHILRALHGPTACCRQDGLTDERFGAVTDFIEANLTQKLSREFLARTDGQSLHHFARMFKVRTGLTPRQYVDRRRCFRARELIQAGRRLVDAAAEVGFFDQPEMCRKFNAVFGCPPGTFVRRPSP